MRDRILVVESNPDRHEMMSQLLTDGSYFVISTSSAEKALERVWKAHPDLIVLSVQLSGMTALQFSTLLREDERLRHIPIMLMSDPLSTHETVAFFRAGIDDHITYTMDKEEILARIRALLRRVYPAEASNQVFEFGGLALRVEERRLVVNGENIRLTRKEFDLLKTLMSRPDKVIPVASLLSAVWGYDKDVSTKTLHVHINRLRQKLGPKATRIKNFSGIGYAFSPDTRDDTSNTRTR